MLPVLLELLAAGGALAQQSALEPVVVTGSRIETQVLEAPYVIGVVSAVDIHAGGLMVNLSESLVRVSSLASASAVCPVSSTHSSGERVSG